MTKGQLSLERSIKLDVREVNEDGTFSGYGSVFGTIDSYASVIDAGAFANTLKNRKSPVRLLWQHDSSEPIGIFTELYEDAHGLRFKAQLNLDPATLGPKAYALLKQGALDGMSIGFYTLRDRDYTDKDGIVHYTEVKLREISLVTFPANEDATVTSVRSAFDELTQEQRVQVLDFINKFRQSPPSETPAEEEVATPPTDHLSAADADEATQDADEELRHLLTETSSAIRAARTALSARQEKQQGSDKCPK